MVGRFPLYFLCLPFYVLLLVCGSLVVAVIYNLLIVQEVGMDML